ncbi:unnamed protein product [Allacma fusca]|uniref:CUB domain-containing protein n=1 Tax=Allacma fusca TaxID=39272 RepID=A0A8J2PMF9_9HEXA|nr:unnamed protein product [Allacma fusca]
MNILQLFLFIALSILVVQSAKASDDAEDWENVFEDVEEETRNSSRDGRFYWLFEGMKKDLVEKSCMGSNNQKGTCVSSFSCKIKNGASLQSNDCRNGVCCQVPAKCGKTNDEGSCLIKQSGATITQNTGSGTNRVYKFPKVKGACQVKLEIDSFELEGEGAVDGECPTESMTVLGSSTVQSLEICGSNTGQHMYLEYGSASHIALSMRLKEGSLSTYSIRSYYIKCKSPKRVPAHCLKYYTGISGKDRSFNNNKGQLNNQNYKVCVERVEGMNSITWNECRDEPGSFSVTGRSGDTEECTMSTTDWVSFLGDDRRHCGQSLTAAPITVSSRPFIMNVHFDGAEISTPNHIFWQTPEPCKWWKDPAYDSDPLRIAVGTGDTIIRCDTDESVPIINFDMLVDLPSLPAGLKAMLLNLDTGNTGFCLEYAQRQ